MFDKLKKWLGLSGEDSPTTQQGARGEVLTPNPAEGVGEPVLSFVETFRKTPGRFKLEFDSEGDGVHCRDSTTGLEFKMFLETVYGFNVSVWHRPLCIFVNGKHTSEFSYKEMSYVYKEIKKILENRANTLNKLKGSRLRKKLIEVYCNETR